jgi:hypothetical protein
LGQLNRESGSQAVRDNYTIEDDRLVTALSASGQSFEAVVYEVAGHYLAARSTEFGFANYEVEVGE